MTTSKIKELISKVTAPDIVAWELLGRLTTTEGIRTQRYTLHLRPAVDELTNKVLVGVDPGLKAAVVLLQPLGNVATAQYIIMPTKAKMSRVARIVRLYDEFYTFGRSLTQYVDTAVTVESAAYGSKFGQVPLAEHRTAALLGLQRALSHIEVKLVPPSSIWKVAMGSGRINPKKYKPWTDTGLPEDVLDALAAALYGKEASRWVGCYWQH